MLGISGNGFLVDLANLATGLYELERVEQVAARVALIAPRVVVAATGAGAFNKAIREEGFVVVAEGLDRRAFLEVVVVPELQEDVLDDLGVLVCRRPAEEVTVDRESLARTPLRPVCMASLRSDGPTRTARTTRIYPCVGRRSDRRVPGA